MAQGKLGEARWHNQKRTAGFQRQIAKPQLTTEDILGDASTSVGTVQVVRELGFANAGMALAGLIAPWIGGWAVPAAIAPAVFLGAAGVLHIAKKGHKGPEEWVATITDLLVSIVLIIFVIGSVAGL